MNHPSTRHVNKIKTCASQSTLTSQVWKTQRHPVSVSDSIIENLPFLPNPPKRYLSLCTFPPLKNHHLFAQVCHSFTYISLSPHISFVLKNFLSLLRHFQALHTHTYTHDRVPISCLCVFKTYFVLVCVRVLHRLLLCKMASVPLVPNNTPTKKAHTKAFVCCHARSRPHIHH